MKSSNLTSTYRAAVLAAALFAAAPPVTADAAATSLRVHHRVDGVYVVEGSFFARTTPAGAFEVLTDYERMPAFVSSMRHSTAGPAQDGRRVVTQEAVGKAGPFSRTIHVVLEVREQAPHRIDFFDTSGRSFSSYSGTWLVHPAPGGVRVDYTVIADPRSAPPLFARPILSSNARALLDEVRMEMTRRASGGAGAGSR